MTLLGRGKERATAMAKITATTEADPYGMTSERTSKKTMTQARMVTGKMHRKRMESITIGG
jgi:hypothetical protein